MTTNNLRLGATMPNSSAAMIKSIPCVDYSRLLARINQETALKSVLPIEEKEDLLHYLETALGCLGSESAMVLKDIYGGQAASLFEVATGYGISTKALAGMEKTALQKLVHRVHYIRHGTWREDAPLVAGKH